MSCFSWARDLAGDLGGLDAARVRLVIGRGTYRVVSSPRCSQWVAEEPLRPGPSVGSEIERGEQRARGVGALGGEKGRTGRECQFGGLLGARCAGDGAPPVGASDGWGMKGRDRRYDHVTRAGFVGSDASLTSWRVTTGRHRCGAVRCPDEDPVKLNAPAFNTGSVKRACGAPSITTGVVASPIRFRIAMLRSLTRSGLAADPRVTLATVDAFHQASPENVREVETARARIESQPAAAAGTEEGEKSCGRWGTRTSAARHR